MAPPATKKKKRGHVAALYVAVAVSMGCIAVGVKIYIDKYQIISSSLSTSFVGEVTWPRAGDITPQVYVTLLGGLGNRLFSVATAYAYCRRHGLAAPIAFQIPTLKDHSEWGGHEPRFDPGTRDMPRTMQELFPRLAVVNLQGYPNATAIVHGPLYEGFQGLPDHDRLKHHTAIVFDGYWFSPEYFNDYNKEILSWYLRPSEAVVRETQSFLAPFAKAFKIGIHLRLGHPEDNFQLPVMDKGFLHKALLKARSSAGSRKPTVLVATDDSSRMGPFLELIQGLSFEYEVISSQHYVELFVLASCDAIILSDSTFSWWSATLGNTKKRVYYDSKYERKHVRMMPQHWHALV